MKSNDDIRQAMRERILLLDGATGTQFQQRGLSGNFDALNRNAPDTVADIHRAYIAAGRKVWVAGSIGPTSKSLTLATGLADASARALDFETLSGIYQEQIDALIEGGADLLLIETCFDALNAKAALHALSKTAWGFPAIVSVSPGDAAGRTLTGQTLEAFWTAVRHYPLTAFGLNCSLGAEQLLPLVGQLAAFCDVPVICYPNAGLPNEMGRYDESPEKMAASIRKMARDGLVNLVGGCCGTTP